VRLVERQDAVRIAEEPDVALEPELRPADRGVARIVGREVVQRRDAGI